MEHKILALSVSCFFSSLSFTMAAPSVNINFSATINLNLSVSVMFPNGQVVDVSEPEIPMPTGFNENLALTNMSDVNENSGNESELLSGTEPVERRSLTLESDSKIVGPFNGEALARLSNAFASIFERCNSPPLVTDFSPLSSPTSPSFSDINPDDLFWIPLSEIDFGESESIECPMENGDEIVVEIIGCESDQEDDDVVFLKEIRRSETKAK